MPSDVFKFADDQVGLFLRHLWATDGCIFTSKTEARARVYYATNSKGLAQDVAALLLPDWHHLPTTARVKQGKYRPSVHTVDDLWS